MSTLCLYLFLQVKWWVTFNEPLETARGDYAGTGGPPGLNMPGYADYLVAYTVLNAHAQVYHLYNETFRPKYNGKDSAYYYIIIIILGAVTVVVRIQISTSNLAVLHK